MGSQSIRHVHLPNDLLGMELRLVWTIPSQVRLLAAPAVRQIGDKPFLISSEQKLVRQFIAGTAVSPGSVFQSLDPGPPIRKVAGIISKE